MKQPTGYPITALDHFSSEKQTSSDETTKISPKI
jgi:hypothetical protein